MARNNRKTHFGGAMRAVDGVIATLELDGKIICKHFAQVIHSKRPQDGPRIDTRSPTESSAEQLVEYCDRTGARVVCISSPETILRDLQGTRADLEARPHQKHRQETIQLPEKSMLRGRVDLLRDR